MMNVFVSSQLSAKVFLYNVTVLKNLLMNTYSDIDITVRIDSSSTFPTRMIFWLFGSLA